MDELDRILNDHITTHNKKFNFYLISCQLVIEFDNNFTENIETKFFLKYSIINIKSSLLYITYIFITKIYKLSNVCNIKRTILKTINDRCRMTYEYYINNPMPLVERRINFIFAKNPKLINNFDRNKNHPIIRKNSHIPFKNQ